MAGKHDKDATRTGRMNWLDDQSNPLIQSYTERLSTFLDALADGGIGPRGVGDQEARLVALMKKVEPQLGEELHDDVTRLLCELTAYNVMQTVHELNEHRTRTTFRG